MRYYLTGKHVSYKGRMENGKDENAVQIRACCQVSRGTHRRDDIYPGILQSRECVYGFLIFTNAHVPSRELNNGRH